MSKELDRLESRAKLRVILINMLSDAEKDGLADHILDGYIDEEILPQTASIVRAEVLKEVGEWLRSKSLTSVSDAFNRKFKPGEMPKE